MIEAKKNVFEGQFELEDDLQENMLITGDAICLSAELNLYRLKNGPRSSFSKQVIFIYQNAKYYLVKSGLYNLIYAYEFFYLSSFAFIPSINWGTVSVSGGIKNTFSVFILLFSQTTILFWISVGAYLILALLYLIQHLKRQTPSPLYNDLIEKLCNFMLFVFMIPVLQNALQQGHCVYNDPAVGYIHLYSNPAIVCFTSSHIASLVIAGIFVILLYAAAILYVAYVRKHQRDFIRYSDTFEIALVMV